MTDKAMIMATLKNYILDQADHGNYKPEWFDLISYCLGYYGYVDTDMIMVVRDLQRTGYIN